MAAGDVYELTIDMGWGGQAISNVHHFVQVGGDGSGDGRIGLAAMWTAVFETPFLGLLVDEVEVLQSRSRRLLPTQTQSILTGIGAPGLVSEFGIPPNQCAILREYGVLDGRKGVGHIKLPGVAVIFVLNGHVNGAYVALAELFGDLLEADQTDPGSGYVFRAAVLGTDDVARKVQKTKQMGRVKTVYSRTIGVGQ